MENYEIQQKVKEIRELTHMADEIHLEIESIQDSLKAVMSQRNTDTLIGADFKITWKLTQTNRFDTKAFKNARLMDYEQFIRRTETRRFVVR